MASGVMLRYAAFWRLFQNSASTERVTENHLRMQSFVPDSYTIFTWQLAL
jgi:hypothetical protein